MRRWLGACLALVVGAAITLWSRGADPRGLAPLNAPVVEIAEEPAVRSVAELASLELESAGQRVAAEFAYESVALGEEPAPMAAAAAAQLSLLVLEPDGRPWQRGVLQLVVHDVEEGAESGALGALDAPSERRARPAGNSANLGSVRLVNLYTNWVTDGEGRAELPGIPPGRTFEVRAVDALFNVGGRLEGAPFAPGEVRAAQIRLESRACPIAGRCIDEFGAPLERVRVAIGDGGPGSVFPTDEDGRFRTPALFGDEVVLVFMRRGVVRWRESVPLPAEFPLEVVLERARSLTVTIVDERGETFTLRGLQARGAENGPQVDTYPEVRDGVHVFESMPRVPVTLEIVGSGSSPTLEVDANAEQARWSLPRMGALEVVRAYLPPDFPTGIVVELRQPGSDAVVFEHELWLSQLQRPPRWSIFPGRYSLQFHARRNPAEPVPYGTPHEIEVRAGETVTVPLGN